MIKLYMAKVHNNMEKLETHVLMILILIQVSSKLYCLKKVYKKNIKQMNIEPQIYRDHKMIFSI